MDLKDIQDLIKFVSKSGATEVDLEIDNIKISIKSPAKKKRGATDEPVTIIQQTPAAIPQVQLPTTNVTHQNLDDSKEIKSVSNSNTETGNENEKKSENHITVKASMIGTFYRSPSPESPPFVNVGDEIKEGDTICIIEAMKLFNEIESECSGKIVKVLVDDMSPIEFDQPLFLIDPS
jgi:acetyl-CoA carboxylase biotin carboxyl carrier protein